MRTCGECYWYSDITVKKCDRENDPTTEDSKACSLFEPKGRMSMTEEIVTMVLWGLITFALLVVGSITL